MKHGTSGHYRLSSHHIPDKELIKYNCQFQYSPRGKNGKDIDKKKESQ